MREQMLHEQTVRLNRENAVLLNRAPDAWQAFKEAFRAECAAINEGTNLTRLQCEDSGANSFDVTRIPVNGRQIGALSFQFDPSMPRIVFTDMRNNKPKQHLEMTLDGYAIHFLRDGKAAILSRFIEESLEAIWP
jgi:hypothetical protein